jgi:dihydropteroate synthase-like protein
VNAPRYLFVTGRLAEAALRRQLDELAAKVGFIPEVAVMPITVAALLTTEWIAKRLTIPEGVEKIILPGFVRGETTTISTDIPVTLGPKDLRDLPEFFGKTSQRTSDYGEYTIQILAEINHAPRLTPEALLALAHHYQESGADIIDLGCDPGSTWTEIGSAVQLLKSRGLRVSVDSFNPEEVTAALAAGAELVLSVNSSNLQHALEWAKQFESFEVVAIPDTPDDLASLDRTAELLTAAGIRHRLDPILEPIGYGFGASLQRYHQTRERYPNAAMMMGVGNLTELTDVDSAGVNVLLAALCEEWRIGSVLATEVIPWARSAVREFDIARCLVHHSLKHKVLPKRLETRLIQLRDPKLYTLGVQRIRELSETITDRNYRLFAEEGELHVVNGSMHLHDTDPFVLFEEMLKLDSKLDPSHSFYLGYEMAKAITALTLSKNYTQDQALNWGHLTRPEISHRTTFPS